MIILLTLTLTQYAGCMRQVRRRDKASVHESEDVQLSTFCDDHQSTQLPAKIEMSQMVMGHHFSIGHVSHGSHESLPVTH